MFKATKAFGSFSVDNLSKAKNFYSEKLGIKVTDEPQMEGLAYLNIDNNKVMVYEKSNHAPATFTVLNFPVKDVEKTVDDLISKGIRFEQYDGELKTDKKGIFRGNGPKIAWFKDPAGNIISVIEEK